MCRIETGLSQQSDESLLEQYRCGIEQAFAELVFRYERELYSYLRKYVGDATLAEDVFQCTFIQVHLKIHLYEKGRPVRPWLYTIATNQAIDALRKAKRCESMSLDMRPPYEQEGGNSFAELIQGENEDPVHTLEGVERRRWVNETLSRLAPHLRSVIIMAYYQGLKYREIAEILGIPVGTVKSRLHAAVAKLGQAWRSSREIVDC